MLAAGEGLCFAYRMNAAQSSSEYQQVIKIVQLRRVTSSANKQRELKIAIAMQAYLAGINNGCHHRYLG